MSPLESRKSTVSLPDPTASPTSMARAIYDESDFQPLAKPGVSRLFCAMGTQVWSVLTKYSLGHTGAPAALVYIGMVLTKQFGQEGQRPHLTLTLPSMFPAS